MRRAWLMRLKPGQEAAYKKKHDEIWPEMVAHLKRRGIRNYSIYRHGLLLFAHYEIDENAPDASGAADAVTLRWRQWMEPHMETNADASPVVEAVEEVFRLD